MPRPKSPPRLVEQGGRYYFVWRDAKLKRERRLSLHQSDPTQAHKAFAELLELSDGGRLFDGLPHERLLERARPDQVSRVLEGRGDEITIGEVIDLYLEKQAPKLTDPVRARQCLEAVRRAWGDWPASCITIEACEEYAERRQAGDWGPKAVKSGTVRRELAMLQAAVNVARKRRRLSAGQEPTIDLPPAGAPRERWLRDDERKRMFELARDIYVRDRGVWRSMDDGDRLPRIYRWLALAYFTGARTEAIENLRWDQVDFENGVIDFRGGRRTKKRRTVVRIDPGLQEILEVAYEERVSGYVLDEWGSTRRAFATLCRRAGLEGVTRHTLRHTRATVLVRRGVPPAIVAQRLGHSLETLLKHYYHDAPEIITGEDAA